MSSNGFVVVHVVDTNGNLEHFPNAQAEQKEEVFCWNTEIQDLEASLFKILTEGWPNRPCHRVREAFGVAVRAECLAPV